MNLIRRLLSALSIKKYYKYLLLGTGVFILGLVWHFPFGRLKETLQSQIYKQTRIVTEMSDIRPALPIGLLFVNPRASLPFFGQNKDVELNSFKIVTTPWSLLTLGLFRSGTLYYAGDTKSAKFSGHLYASKKILALSNQTKNLKINDTFKFANAYDPYSTPAMEVGLVATVGSSIEAEGNLTDFEKNNFTTLKGVGKLTLDQVSVETPLLSGLTFDKVTLDAKADKGVIDIRSIVLNGKQVSGKASGNIKINAFMPDSELKIDATLSFVDNTSPLKSLVQTLGSGFGLTMDAAGNVALKITGTFSRPTIRGY